MTTLEEIFGKPVHVYTRDNAVSDGVLVRASPELVRDARMGGDDVALTAAVWADCVTWTDEDTERKGVPQDVDGRLFDVLWMASRALATGPRRGERVPFAVMRVPRAGRGRLAREVVLHVMWELGSDGRRAVTILMPGED